MQCSRAKPWIRRCSTAFRVAQSPFLQRLGAQGTVMTMESQRGQEQRQASARLWRKWDKPLGKKGGWASSCVVHKGLGKETAGAQVANCRTFVGVCTKARAGWL